jgi:ubiquinone/menaquinone biosynthesis C-methylase UbiE
VVEHVRASGGGRVLSIGSGPGGQELDMSRRLKGVPHELVCLDLNPHLTALGQKRADDEGLPLNFQVQDINDLVLGTDEFDVIFCFASLHHLINLEHISYEINRALKPTGKLVVVDICTRNGYFMWPETHGIVQDIWAMLPDRFKYNHTSYATPQIDRYYENRDFGGDSMECARSADIVPILDQYLNRTVYVPYFALTRRFFDTMYGPNYDLDNPLDRSILDMIWNLDVHYLTTGVLKPETFFGVYTKRRVGRRPPKYGVNGFVPGGRATGAAEPSSAMELNQMLRVFRRLKTSLPARLMKPILRRLFR